MEYVITTDKLTKKYGKKAAALDVDIRVRQGEIYGLIGRNGAGKTTILRMLSGLARPTSGSYTLFGKQGDEARRQMENVGVLIEAPGIYPKLSAHDNLKIKCISLGINKKGYIESLLELVGLANVGKMHTGRFSLGMKQRLGIALALVGEPKLIILDEPINGLDPQGIVDVRRLLTYLRDERKITIMISSHILEELGKLADAYGIINNGVIIDEFTKEEIIKRTGVFTLIDTDDNKKALELIKPMGFEKAELEQDGLIHIGQELDRSKDVVKRLVENGLFIKEVKLSSFSLEDYYLNVTGGNPNA